MRTTILERQTLLDVALAQCGAFEAALALARRNGLALTDELTAGETLEYLPEEVLAPHVVELLAARRIAPATAPTAADAAAAPWGGIGYMGIETDFLIR